MRLTNILVSVIFLHLANITYPQDSTTTSTYLLGDCEVGIRSTCFNNCDVPYSFINLHNDENTAIDAATFYLEYEGGLLMQLTHEYGRNICFNLNGQGYTFDPNRIFTPAGRRATLENLGTYNEAADSVLVAFAEEITSKFVDKKALVISMHNNTDKLFSILSYKKGNSEAQSALRLYINNEMDPDDFVYTTDPVVFDTVMAHGINVVLQNNATVNDDGSLSIYAAARNIPYINFEAEHEHLDEQIRMIEALSNISKSYRAQPF